MKIKKSSIIFMIFLLILLSACQQPTKKYIGEPEVQEIKKEDKSIKHIEPGTEEPFTLYVPIILGKGGYNDRLLRKDLPYMPKEVRFYNLVRLNGAKLGYFRFFIGDINKGEGLYLYLWDREPSLKVYLKAYESQEFKTNVGQLEFEYRPNETSNNLHIKRLTNPRGYPDITQRNLKSIKLNRQI